MLEYIDAFNIDLKAFTDNFYRKVTGARLDPVLSTLKQIVTAGKHLEITNLIIPTQNDNDDDFRAMVKWIADELGKEIVLHLSRYHPMYKMDIDATSARTLQHLAGIACEFLSYVYVGNIQLNDYQNTLCIKCGTVLIKRLGYYTEIKAVDEKGCCTKCGNKAIIQ